tara:strand:- start:1936 stop:2118 length:183 start_codon:yes stop_codon:yes gene_type:complete
VSSARLWVSGIIRTGPVSLNADPLIRGMQQNVVRVTRIDFRWSQPEQTAIKLKKYKAQDP